MVETTPHVHRVQNPLGGYLHGLLLCPALVFYGIFGMWAERLDIWR
jgi:hypothetical protein